MTVRARFGGEWEWHLSRRRAGELQQHGEHQGDGADIIFHPILYSADIIFHPRTEKESGKFSQHERQRALRILKTRLGEEVHETSWDCLP